MAIKILHVASSSPAAKAGIHPNEIIVSINGESVIDEIDYQDLIQHPHLELILSDEHGNKRQVSIAKSKWEPLGIRLDESNIMKPRSCQNHCLFCFIDQMPPGMRSSLYVKDDDWRLSLMMGNYVTLTNVNDQEFSRILRRKASPLYISVHATDGEVRKRLLRNPNADKILDRLTALKNHNLQFHAQIVLCPGWNDGDVLKKTIEDLAALWPAALSMAIVPIGMTKFRDGLTSIPAVTPEMAKDLIKMIEEYQTIYLQRFGTRFVFLSDEFYCLSNENLPEESAYEGYPQIENGVGMIRQLEDECKFAWEDLSPVISRIPPSPKEHQRMIIPTGQSAYPHLERIVNQYKPDWVDLEVIPVKNKFFGESITVTGLIVGQDLLSALSDKIFDIVLISENMLRENTDCFLDGMTLEEITRILGKPIRVVKNNGESLIRSLYSLEDCIND